MIVPYEHEKCPVPPLAIFKKFWSPLSVIKINLVPALRSAQFQWYKAMLCTFDLDCAPLTCVVHHAAESGHIL